MANYELVNVEEKETKTKNDHKKSLFCFVVPGQYAQRQPSTWGAGSEADKRTQDFTKKAFFLFFFKTFC